MNEQGPSLTAESDDADKTATYTDPLRTNSTNGSDNKQQSILQRIRHCLLQLNGFDSNENCGDAETRRRTQLQRRKRLAAISVLSLVVIAYFRYKRRRGGGGRTTTTTAHSSLLLWPVAFLSSWWKGPDYRQSPQESPMSLLWNSARDGVIQQALIGSSAIFFQTKPNSGITGVDNKNHNRDKPVLRWYRTVLPPNNESIKSGLLEALAAGGCEDIQALPESIWSQLATPVLAALPFLYLAFLYRIMKNQFGGEDISSRLKNGTRKLLLGDADGHEPDDRTTFADVAGLQSAVEDVREIVSYLIDPSIYRGLGARPPRGVLLYGPPGTGKTLLARAVAGEAHCDTFVACSGSDFVEMYVGRGASRVRALFDMARRDALRRRKLKLASSWWASLFGVSSSSSRCSRALKNRPAVAILFIDELDALAKSRSYDGMHGNDEREQTLNQLLTEMDGFSTGSSKENDSNESEEVALIVIAASNRADVIDPAVLRRFERQICVGYPDAKGRKEILLVHSNRIHCTPKPIDWERLASDAVTGNFSGAELRNVVNEAALFAVREKSPVVEESHLLHAARKIQLMKTSMSNNYLQHPVRHIPGFLGNID